MAIDSGSRRNSRSPESRLSSLPTYMNAILRLASLPTLQPMVREWQDMSCLSA
jgi:hypothetical protein